MSTLSTLPTTVDLTIYRGDSLINPYHIGNAAFRGNFKEYLNSINNAK